MNKKQTKHYAKTAKQFQPTLKKAIAKARLSAIKDGFYAIQHQHKITIGQRKVRAAKRARK